MDTIEGTWRFVRAMARDDAGNPRPLPYEGQGMGRVVIGGGRLAVMMIDWRHDIPGGQKREYSGYTGTYTFDGKQLVPGVKALIAHIHDDAGWSRVQPPLSVFPARDRTAVSAAYDSLRGRSARERETGAKARVG